MSHFAHALVFIAVGALAIGFSLYQTQASVPEVIMAPTLTATPVVTLDAPILSSPKVRSQTITIPTETAAAEVREPVPSTTPLHTTEEERTEERVIETTTEPEVTIQQVTPAKTLSTVADMVMDQTNKVRLKNGLEKYTYDAQLSSLAKERSQDMIEKDYFSHTEPNGCGIDCHFKESNYASLVWGENVAEFRSSKEENASTKADMFMDDWLQSATHKDNILSENFTHQGIGVTEKNGRTVITVIFANPE